MNVSIEKQTDGKLGGYIRIRSKTQGIALSVGMDQMPNFCPFFDALSFILFQPYLCPFDGSITFICVFVSLII